MAAQTFRPFASALCRSSCFAASSNDHSAIRSFAGALRRSPSFATGIPRCSSCFVASSRDRPTFVLSQAYHTTPLASRRPDAAAPYFTISRLTLHLLVLRRHPATAPFSPLPTRYPTPLVSRRRLCFHPSLGQGRRGRTRSSWGRHSRLHPPSTTLLAVLKIGRGWASSLFFSMGYRLTSHLSFHWALLGASPRPLSVASCRLASMLVASPLPLPDISRDAVCASASP
mmetsp:Transcript_5858/g.12274  ORF Transcript_5858/g.12274 Transcript_5858/m.12274 type:complete len:228 (+) Transcript_5858:1082-1765(+)